MCISPLQWCCSVLWSAPECPLVQCGHSPVGLSLGIVLCLCSALCWTSYQVTVRGCSQIMSVIHSTFVWGKTSSDAQIKQKVKFRKSQEKWDTSFTVYMTLITEVSVKMLVNVRRNILGKQKISKNKNCLGNSFFKQHPKKCIFFTTFGDCKFAEHCMYNHEGKKLN